jgi:hypothetical protein
MSIHVKEGGTWRTVTGVWRKISGTWQPISSASTKVSGAWQVVFGTFIATVDTTTVFGFDTAPGAPVSDPVTCTPDGGTAPYSYLWERVSGDVVTIDSSTSAETTFSFVNSSGSFVMKTGVYRCRVTDATATVVFSPDVTVTLESTP